MQRLDLGMQRLPACWALGHALLGGCLDVWGRYEHRDRPLGQRHGLLAPCGIDSIESLVMRGEDLAQSFPEILQQMKAVGDLDGGGCPVSILALGPATPWKRALS